MPEERDPARAPVERGGDMADRAAGEHDSVVKRGGVAQSNADVEDITRDTYGSPIGGGGSAEPSGRSRPHGDMLREEISESIDEAIDETRHRNE